MIRLKCKFREAYLQTKEVQHNNEFKRLRAQIKVSIRRSYNRFLRQSEENLKIILKVFGSLLQEIKGNQSYPIRCIMKPWQ